MKILKFFNSLKFKIIALFIAVLTCTYSYYSYVFYQSLSKILTQYANEQLLNKAELIARKTNISPIIIPMPEKNESFKIFITSNDSSFILFQSTGFPDLPLEIQKQPTTFIYKDKRIAATTISVNENESEKLSVYLAVDNDLHAIFKNMLQHIVIIGITSTILAGFLTLIFSIYLIKPIDSIIGKANQIHANSFNETIELQNSSTEFIELTKTLNKMLNRIKESTEIQKNFFASAAHELRTPLFIMQTELEIFRMNENIPKEFRDLLDNQLEEVKRLQRLTEDFLTVGKLNTDEIPLNLDLYYPDSIIFTGIEKIERLIHRSNARLNLEMDQNIKQLKVICDFDKILSVFINILENALKYRLPETPINITLKSEPATRKVAIQVTNQISQKIEQIEKLKEQFYKGDLLNKGFGLGLWISNKVMEAHQGELVLEQNDNTFKAKIILRLSD